jgi:hypothetical protein
MLAFGHLVGCLQVFENQILVILQSVFGLHVTLFNDLF